jgi:hypothetical protein
LSQNLQKIEMPNLFCTGLFPCATTIASPDQAFGRGIPALHGISKIFSSRGLAPPYCATGFLLDSHHAHRTREATALNLALRLNVLAVFAVFVFVGAILLGAF